MAEAVYLKGGLSPVDFAAGIVARVALVLVLLVMGGFSPVVDFEPGIEARLVTVLLVVGGFKPLV